MFAQPFPPVASSDGSLLVSTSAYNLSNAVVTPTYLATRVLAGANVTVTPNTTTGAVTIAAAGGGTSGPKIVNGAGATLTPFLSETSVPNLVAYRLLKNGDSYPRNQDQIVLRNSGALVWTYLYIGDTDGNVFYDDVTSLQPGDTHPFTVSGDVATGVGLVVGVNGTSINNCPYRMYLRNSGNVVSLENYGTDTSLASYNAGTSNGWVTSTPNNASYATFTLATPNTPYAAAPAFYYAMKTPPAGFPFRSNVIAPNPSAPRGTGQFSWNDAANPAAGGSFYGTTNSTTFQSAATGYTYAYSPGDFFEYEYVTLTGGYAIYQNGARIENGNTNNGVFFVSSILWRLGFQYSVAPTAASTWNVYFTTGSVGGQSAVTITMPYDYTSPALYYVQATSTDPTIVQAYAAVNTNGTSFVVRSATAGTFAWQATQKT